MLPLNKNLFLLKLLRIPCWGVFLIPLFFTIGIPETALYAGENLSLKSFINIYIAKLFLSGFFAVAAFEYLCRCYLSSLKNTIELKFFAFSVLTAFLYYPLNIFLAHTVFPVQSAICFSWFILIYFMGVFLGAGYKSLNFALMFHSLGAVSLVVLSVAWSVIYNRYIQSNNLELTPYIMVFVTVLAWVLLAVFVLQANRLKAKALTNR